ncbi:hypothetical protein B5M09_000922 [Aphanomyces astaci]|uniref:Uncharacterized protein n=1 Tax=Aphanomyces astaci TaxID=112090 RepID=A0A3R7WHL6_APHAT|nr:hypothetical protein B5M09_000922 [Aphanomyces astaci]
MLVPGLSPLTWYNVSVMAVNLKSACESSSAGSRSPVGLFRTNETSLPHPVTSLVDTSSTGGGITLAWQPPFDRGVGMNDTLIFSLYMKPLTSNVWNLIQNDTRTSAWVMNLASETSYYFGVDTTSSAGSAGLASMLVKTFKTSGISVPGPPWSPFFVNHTGGSITVGWAPPSDDGGEKVTSYVVEVQGIDGTQLTSANQFTFYGLLASTAYNIRVAAVNLMGTGSASAYATLSTSAASPALPPTTPKILSQSGGAVTLSFTPPLDTGGVPLADLSYAVYANNVLVTTISHAEFVQSASSTSSTRELSVVTSDLESVSTLHRRRRLDASGSVTVGNLNPSTVYDFQVRAVSVQGGTSGGSPQQSGQTSQPTTPGPPDSPKLDKATGGLLSFSWNAVTDSGGSSITAFVLKLVNVDTHDVKMCEGMLFQCTISGLEATATFATTLQAANAIGMSSPSNVLEVRTEINSAPSTPVNFGMVNMYATAIDLAWSAPRDFGGSVLQMYSVDVTTVGTSTLVTKLVDVPADASQVVLCTVDDLTPLTQYSRAVTFDQLGDVSKTLTLTTPADANAPLPPCDHDQVLVEEINPTTNMSMVLWRGGCTRHQPFGIVSTFANSDMFVTFTTDSSVTLDGITLNVESFDAAKDTPRVTQIPCPSHQNISCANNGICTGASGLCLCSVGYTGEDCSQRILCTNGLVCPDGSAFSGPDEVVMLVDAKQGNDERGTGAVMNATAHGTASKAVRSLAKALDFLSSFPSTKKKTILLYPGEYVGAINCDVQISNAQIDIHGVYGASLTVFTCPEGQWSVDGGMVSVTGVTFQSRETDSAQLSVTGGGVLKLFQSSVRGGVGSSELGGGIYVELSSVYLEQSVISQCSANYGGAIYAYNSSVTLNNSRITDNLALLDGGGIYADGSSAVSGWSSFIQSNSATRYGGGVFALGLANVLWSDPLGPLEIALNVASYGGGIAINGSLASSNVRLTSNNATTDGGGLYLLTSSSVSDSNSVIMLNHAMQSGGGVFTLSDQWLWFRQSTVSQNSAKWGGGMAIHDTTCVVTGVTIHECTSELHGGGLSVVNSTVELVLVVITHNTANASGGGVYLRTAALTGPVDIAENAAGMSGGGIFIQGESTLQLASISRCTAPNGGGFHAISSPSLQLNSVTVANCTATQHGGGGVLENVRAVTDSFVVQDNAATFGGGLHVDGAHLVTGTGLGRCVIQFNKAAFGGGVSALSSPSPSSLRSVTLQNNIAHDKGGAMFAQLCTVGLVDVFVDSCSTPGQGGGLYLLRSTVEHSNVLVQHCSATDGGGVFLSSASLEPPGALTGFISLSHNEANTMGGNIHLANHSSMSYVNSVNGTAWRGGGVSGSQWSGTCAFCIVADSEANQGGGMYLYESSIYLTHSSIRRNFGVQGGGMYLNYANVSHDRVVVEHNVAAEGPGFWIGNTTTVSSQTGTYSLLTGNYFDNATAEYFGGANVFIGESVTGFELANWNISAGQAYRGGGAYVSNGASGAFRRCLFQFNLASSEGGGVFVMESTTLTIESCLFDSNVAPSGAALLVNSDASFSYSSANVTVIDTVVANHKGSRHGAFRVLSANVNAIRCDFTNNSVDGGGFGGAVSFKSTRFAFTASTFSHNSATQGATVYLESNSQGTFTSCTLSGNCASMNSVPIATHGGVLYIGKESSATLAGSTVVTCGSAVFGGGIYVATATLTIRDESSIVTHRATQFAVLGGGLYISDTTSTLIRCTFHRNSADRGAGVAVDRSGNLVASGCVFVENVADDVGGAIVLLSKTVAAVTNQSSFTGNVGRSGGGIYMESASQLSLDSAEFYENQAASNGGGIAVAGNAALNMSHCAFVENVAVDGAGLHLATTSWVQLQDSSFTANQASFRGGAVFVQKSSTTVSQRLSVTSNVATSGGGVFWLIGSTTAPDVFHCSDCSIHSNDMYDKATDSMQFAVSWWPTHATSGTYLVKVDEVESIVPVNVSVDGGESKNLWPRLMVQDYYGQQSVTDNSSTCIIQAATNQTTGILFEPGVPFLSQTGTVTFLNAAVVSDGANITYALEAVCSIPLANEGYQYIDLNVTVYPCKPGFRLAENNGDYLPSSLDGQHCFDCPKGGNCDQFVVNVAFPDVQLAYGVTFPRTVANFMTFEATKTVLAGCVPSTWDSTDPCLQFAAKQVGGVTNLKESSAIDLNLVMNDCAHLKTSIAFQKYWPPERQYSCLTNSSFYKCEDGTDVKILGKAHADRKFQVHNVRVAEKGKVAKYIEAKVSAWKAKNELKAAEKKKHDKSIVFGIAPVNVIVGVYLSPEKIKILIGFFQIFGNLKKTYEVQWPNTVNSAMDSTSNLLFVILGFLLGVIAFFYVHGIHSYEKKLSSIPRNCTRCGHPVRESYSRRVYERLPATLAQGGKVPPKLRQSLHRLSCLVDSEPDANAPDDRKIKRELGISTVKTDVLSVYPSRHLQHQCPSDDVLSGKLLDRTLRANLRVWQARTKLRMNYHSYKNKCFKLFMWLLLILYPNVCQYILNIFNCQEIGNKYYMVVDRSLVCYDAQWGFYSLFGFVGLGAWVAGVPLFFYIVINRVRTANIRERMIILKNPRYRYLRHKWTRNMRAYFATRGRYIKEHEFYDVENDLLYEYMCYLNMTDSVNRLRVGFIYQNYVPEFWWFEVLELLRKLFMNGLVIFVHNNPVLKAVLSITWSILLMSGILYYRPYVAWSNNLVSSMTQFQLILTLWVGLVLVLNAQTGLNLLNQQQIVNIMLILNFMAVVATGYIMLDEARSLSKQQIAIQEAERKDKIRHAVTRLWQKAYNHAVYKAMQTNQTGRTFSVPAFLEAVRLHKLELAQAAE